MKVIGVYVTLKSKNPKLSFENRHYFFTNQKSAILWAENVYSDIQVLSLDVIGESGEIFFSDNKEGIKPCH